MKLSTSVKFRRQVRENPETERDDTTAKVLVLQYGYKSKLKSRKNRERITRLRESSQVKISSQGIFKYRERDDTSISITAKVLVLQYGYKTSRETSQDIVKS
jgi:hypothetical protein